MDTTPSTPANHAPAQGAARGGGPGLSPLASGSPAQEQATPDWDPSPLPAGDPRRGDQELCRLGLRLEGGYLRSWHEVLPREREGEGSGLGRSQDAGGGRPLLGDRFWGDAQVRALWEEKAWQWWAEDSEVIRDL